MSCDAIFIAVGTPQSETGDADLSYVEAVACEIARSLTSYKVIVEKSTVPVYTNEWIRRAIERNGVARGLFDVVSNPEFLREGTAVADFLHPDRIVVGADSEAAAALLGAIYAPLTSGEYYTRPNAIPGACSRRRSAATPAQYVHQVCRDHQARLKRLSCCQNLLHQRRLQPVRGHRRQHRAGCPRRRASIAASDPRFLRPGIGYGGSCFPKDVAAFRSVAEQLGIDFSLLTEVEKINVQQKKRFLSKVRSALWTLRGKRLGVLGLAFKGETDDIRESPAIDLVEMLLAEGCSIAAYDPAAMRRAQQEIPRGPRSVMSRTHMRRPKTPTRCSSLPTGPNLQSSISSAFTTPCATRSSSTAEICSSLR